MGSRRLPEAPRRERPVVTEATARNVIALRRWRGEGLPLRIVLRGIADALDAHAHSFSRERKVGSLRYCEAEVAAVTVAESEKASATCERG